MATCCAALPPCCGPRVKRQASRRPTAAGDLRRLPAWRCEHSEPRSVSRPSPRQVRTSPRDALLLRVRACCGVCACVSAASDDPKAKTGITVRASALSETTTFTTEACTHARTHKTPHACAPCARVCWGMKKPIRCVTPAAGGILPSHTQRTTHQTGPPGHAVLPPAARFSSGAGSEPCPALPGLCAAGTVKAAGSDPGAPARPAVTDGGLTPAAS